MRRLELTSYGAFSDRAIEVGPGLTVVHGPNESGKSTLTYAVADLLWGVQPRLHPYAFLVNPSQLRLTAIVAESLESADERTLVVDSRGYRGVNGVAVAPWWRNGSVTSRDAWTTAFGLDLPGLRSGGRSVLENGGDLASVLFRARTGVDVVQALETLTTRAESAYRRHAGARRVRVRELLAAAELARESTVEATSSAAEVARLRNEVVARERHSDGAHQEYTRQEAAHGAAEEARRAWEPVANLVAARNLQQQLRALGRVFDVTDLKAYDDARLEITSLIRQIAELDGELATLDKRLGELVVDDVVLAIAPIVDDLQTRQALEKRRVEELAKQRSRLATVREEIRRVAASLAPRSADGASGAPAGGDTADDALRARATALLIPVDVVDRIQRGAQVLRALEEEIRIEDGEVAIARERLTTLNPAEAGPDDGIDLHEVRAVRDRAWTEVKDPWLRGVLPDDETRAQLAELVEFSTQEADAASDRASALAEGTGRVLEVNAQLGARVLHREELRVRHRNLEQAWANLLAEAGVPSIVDPVAWDVRWAVLEELSSLLHDERGLMASLETDELAASEYTAEVLAVGREFKTSSTEIWSVLSTAVGRVSETRSNQATVVEVRDGRERGTRKCESLASALAGHEAVIARLRADDELEEVAERSRKVAIEREREHTYLNQVDSARRPGTDLEELVSRLSSLEAADLEAQESSARVTLAESLVARDDARAALQEARGSLRDAERVGDAATLLGHEVEAAEVLAAQVREYIETRVMIIALERLLAAEEPDHDTALLDHASELVGRLTDGRVTGLTVEDRAGERRLRIEAVGLDEGIANELSEGTADQVFLALRLAGIRQMQERAVADGGVTLPVVLDDVLTTHDDGRTARALEVLASEARDQQILLMTHHSAVAVASRRTKATVVSLDPLPDLSLTQATARPAHPARPASAADPGLVREWARSQGIDVGDRGRIKGWIVEAYVARDRPDVDD